jgi:tetratricopeptide (TPR) repeat protein
MSGGGFQAKHDPCAWFIPVAPPESPPQWYALTLAVGGGQSREEPHSTCVFRVEHPVRSPFPDPVFPTPEFRPGEIAFHWEEGVAAEVTRAGTRARYWRRQGNLQRALAHYEQMIDLADRELHRRYFQPWTWFQIGSLYEELGMLGEARDAYGRGLECDRGREWEQETVDRLRHALERLD